MNRVALVVIISAFVLAACQPESPEPSTVTIVDGETVKQVGRTVNSPAALLIAAGITALPEDMLLVNGQPAMPDSSIPDGPATLQIHRAVPVTVISDRGQITINSAAPTVGMLLDDLDISLHANDYLDPPAATPILGPMTIEHQPAVEIVVATSTEATNGASVAKTVGQALAEAGIPLQGIDYSIPAESEPIPVDGKIRIVRVNESVVLVQKSIPYNVEVQLTADLELDQQELLQLGEPGLAVTRTRTRYEDGQEVEQKTDPEAMVRPAKDRIIGAGTKIVIRTLDTPDGPIEYYRAVQVYATSYSPCRLGVPWCGYGTAGGMKAQKGVIGVIRSWWRFMNGDPVYVPGYGRAIISDIGAGIKGRYWIDLGYSDDDYISWHNWTTIYFLTPVPPTIMYVLQ